MSTKIVATLGPASLDLETLTHFKNSSVEIARLNFSHDTVQNHTDRGLLAKSLGLNLLIDLGGPKIRLGEFINIVNLEKDRIIALELQDFEQEYPFDYRYQDSNIMILPCRFDIADSTEAGKTLLIDDGKISLEVVEIIGQKVFCKVVVPGPVKSAKSINLPYSTVKLPFLTDRDKHMLRETIAVLRPEYVACSFVKNQKDVDEMRAFIQKCLDWFEIKDYFPKICVKLETHEVVQPQNLEEVIKACDIAMIARGDMALETLPAHIMVPYYQDEIARLSKLHNTPFIVATEALDSMISKPSPSRAEISDIYRSIAVNKADYIMLSGESANGSYPKEAVSMMNSMIKQYDK
jgi:pyruvate kinase